jgi:ABC-type transporter lipoprotein component MlaA
VVRVSHSKLISHSKLLLLIIGIVLVSGCAAVRPRDRDTSFEKIDPYEKANRKSYAFTDWVDRKIMEPVADVYIDYIPVKVQRSVTGQRTFFSQFDRGHFTFGIAPT